MRLRFSAVSAHCSTADTREEYNSQRHSTDSRLTIQKLSYTVSSAIPTEHVKKSISQCIIRQMETVQVK
jgi:hypothetical protein